jgi:hypothetical protein
VIAGEKNLRQARLGQEIIFYLIDFTNIYSLNANVGRTKETGGRLDVLSGIP